MLATLFSFRATKESRKRQLSATGPLSFSERDITVENQNPPRRCHQEPPDSLLPASSMFVFTKTEWLPSSLQLFLSLLMLKNGNKFKFKASLEKKLEMPRTTTLLRFVHVLSRVEINPLKEVGVILTNSNYYAPFPFSSFVCI